MARLAGVSKASVSNTFLGRRAVGQETRRRVLAAADRLRYRPHYAAQALARRKTMTVGLLVSELYNPFTGALIERFEQSLQSHGYRILLGLTYGNRDRGVEYLRDFSSGMVDGVLNLASEVSPAEAVRESGEVPVVTFLRPSGESPVYVDYPAGVTAAMDHLWGLGHRRIGLISLPRMMWEKEPHDPWTSTYRHYYQGKGLVGEEELAMEGDAHPESGYRLAGVLHGRGATAILAGNDLMACGVLRWAREAEVHVPEELSLVGADDGMLAVLVGPALTTIQLPIELMVEPTVQGLMDRLAGRPPGQPRVIVPSLIVRQSTGGPR